MNIKVIKLDMKMKLKKLMRLYCLYKMNYFNQKIVLEMNKYKLKLLKLD